MVHRVKAAAAALALLALAATTTPASANVLGIHTMIQDNNDVIRQLDQAAALCGRGGWVKQLMYVQDGSEWHFDPKWVQFTDGARKRHLNVVARLHYVPPGWRASADAFASKPKSDPDGTYNAYRDLIRGFVQRFNGRLHYAEIWNEPNIGLEWDWQASPEEFVRAMMAGYDGVKEADPTCQVLFPGLAPTGDNANGNMDNEVFLRRCFESSYLCPRDGRPFKDHFDILGNHSYALNHPVDYRDDKYSAIGYVWEWNICALFGKRPPVLITECGYLLGNREDTRYPAVTEENRATNIYRSFRDVWARDSRVLGAMPYYLHASEGWRGHESGFWWVQNDGTPTPQYNAVKALRPVLEDAPGNLLDPYGNAVRVFQEDGTDMADAVAILRVAFGVTPAETLEWRAVTRADVWPRDDPDERLTVEDALSVLQLIAGLETH